MITQIQPHSFSDKLRALLVSRRFWAAVGGVATVVFQDVVGLDERTATWITAVLIGWIVGDSLRKTE